MVICNRYNKDVGNDIYCQWCDSCQECGCCPCNKDDCYWCGDKVAYEKIRKQLLLWASSYNSMKNMKQFRKSAQRVMALLRYEYYSGYIADD